MLLLFVNPCLIGTFLSWHYLRVHKSSEAKDTAESRRFKFHVVSWLIIIGTSVSATSPWIWQNMLEDNFVDILALFIILNVISLFLIGTTLRDHHRRNGDKVKLPPTEQRGEDYPT
ncbi:MAG: hypothetical protein ABL949_01695 [Fimbriimonadaceae bacterium]